MAIRKAIQDFNRFLFYVGGVPLFVAMLLTVVDVTGRYFRHPLLGTMELGQLCLVLMVTLSLGHTQAEKGNIDIDTFFLMLPARVQAITSVITTTLSLAIIGLIAWRTIPWILLSRRMMEWTDIFQLPVWIFKASLFLGIVCLCLQLILDIIDYAKALSGKAGVNAA